MSKYRGYLPQLCGGLFLTDGGIETTLIFHDRLELPHFAAFHLLRERKGREALVRYYERHLAIAKAEGVGFVLESPTWRVLGVGDKQMELCLMDLKEAVQAAAPADDTADMPADQAQRVVEGARHLSPYLGERMREIQMFGRSIFIRELLPQDLKIELETLTREQAMNISRFLANVVGKAHARQMDEDTRSNWAKELSRRAPVTLRLPPGSGAALSTCLQFMRRHTWSTVGCTR